MATELSQSEIVVLIRSELAETLDDQAANASGDVAEAWTAAADEVRKFAGWLAGEPPAADVL